jgi:predicted DNA-binding transcriptional regulator YafY
VARPTSRVLALLELLQSGGTRTVAELAGRLEVDERTVRRYVGHLLDLDVPVESVRGRYGGYRLARGYRLPPLMLDDDEALAVVLGLGAGPGHLTRRLEAALGSVAFTGAGPPPPPDAAVLLTLADAVRHSRPVSVTYTDRQGRRTERVLHPHGLVVHSERWYLTGADPAAGEDRTFRLDRITSARTLPGTVELPAALDTAERVVHGFATAGYRHEVTVHVDASLEAIRARLPVSVAVVEESGAAAPSSAPSETWWRVEIRAEDLGWLPPVLASLDRPFVVERPVELRDLVAALADRLAASARRRPDG